MSAAYPALVNPWASQVQNGLLDASPSGYADVGYDYVTDVTLNPSALAAGTYTTLVLQPLDNDADFVWRGIGINYFTGAFAARFADNTSYWFSNARIYYLNFINSASSPYPVWPEIILAAGGNIQLDLQDWSGASNTLEFVFRGVKRFRLPQEQS